MKTQRSYNEVRIVSVNCQHADASRRITMFMEKFGCNIKQITFDSCQIPPAILAQLISFATHLQILILKFLWIDCKIDVMALKRIRLTRSFYKTCPRIDLHELKEVEVTQCGVEYCEMLLGLPSNLLTKFHTDNVWNEVSFRDFLFKQQKISSYTLNFYHYPFAIGFAHLNLTHLDATNRFNTEYIDQALKKQKNLKNLRVNGEISDQLLEQISKMQTLEVLKVAITKRNNSEAAAANMRKCLMIERLKELEIVVCCGGLAHLGFVNQLPEHRHLRKLVIDIFKGEFFYESLNFLIAAVPYLEEFNLTSSLTQELLQLILASLKNLKCLKIESVLGNHMDEISLLDVTALNENLKKFSIRANAETDVQIVRHLSICFPNVNHLELDSCVFKPRKISIDAELETWKSFKKLRYLKLNGEEKHR